MSPLDQVKDVIPTYELIDEDGEPLETAWHRYAMNLLLELIVFVYRGRDDYYAGGNMFIYFSPDEAFNKDFRGPDVFLVKGVSHTPIRRYWVVWLEGGRYPDLIVELISPKTAHVDRTTKKDIYEKVFRTAEYFCYDPDTRAYEGWRLHDGRYRPIAPDGRGRLWSEQLGLWLGTWEGVHSAYHDVWPRLFEANGEMVPTFAEAAELHAEIEKERADEIERLAEGERLRADEARRLAEGERRQAVEARRVAEGERRRAEEAGRMAEEERRQAGEARHAAREERRQADEARRVALEAGRVVEETQRRAQSLEAEIAQLRAQLAARVPPPAP